MTFWTKATYCRASAPHFAFVDFLEFLFKKLTVIWAAVHVEHPAGFIAADDAGVERFENGACRILELGEPVERAALREAVEESGMARFEFAHWAGALTPLDLDVHAIPARGSEPEHLHWDVRFWLRAAPGQALAISEESTDLRWFTPAELTAATAEESVVRMLRKVAHLQARGGGRWQTADG